MSRKFIAYFDGACGPINPGGDVGVGSIIFNVTNTNIVLHKFGPIAPVMPTWEEAFKCSKFYKSFELGRTSNNVAEYMAFHECAVWIKENAKKEDGVLFLGDSKLVVNQMNNFWRIKDGIYKESALEAKEVYNSIEVKNKFVSWIPREFNTVADDLSKLEGKFKY